MAGRDWHEGGRLWGGPLLISLGLHFLGLALVGMNHDLQIRTPPQPTSIKVGLIFKPARQPVTTTALPSIPPQRAKRQPQAEKQPAAKPAARPVKKNRPKKPLMAVKTAPPKPTPEPPTPSTSMATPVPAPTAVPAETVTPATTIPATASAPASPRIAPTTTPAYQTYLEEIRQRINHNKRYPRMARRGGQQGVALVYFEIDATGKLCRVKVERGSGFKLLDRAAMKAVHAAAPFSRLPEDVGPNLALRVPIRFELKR